MSKEISTQSDSIISRLLSLKLKTQLLTLVGLLAIGFTIAGFIANKTYNNVLVNGPVYSEIVSNKDLVADILPPPAYLLESWQVALEMAAIHDEPLQPLIEKSNKLAEDFAARSKYWESAISDQKMLEVYKKELQPSGEEFLRIRDSIYIPAARSGNPKLIEPALRQLKSAYEKHRIAVDMLATMATNQSKTIESTVASDVSSAGQTVLVLALIVMSMVVAGIFVVVSNTIRQLGGEAKDAGGGKISATKSLLLIISL